MVKVRLVELVFPFWALVIFMAIPGFTHAQLIVAHRGASHDAPENTLAAFQLAWEQNADGIEADFRITADGHIVCCHDRTTGRTAGVDLDISHSTLEELKRLDVGKWKGEQFAGERIPTLAEVIATIPDGKQIVIELKCGPEVVPPLQIVLEESALKPPQILVICFNQTVIREFKLAMPEVRAHWLSGYSEDDENSSWTPTPGDVARTIREIGADGYGSEGKTTVFDQAFVRNIRDQGVGEFHVWTIDDPNVARLYRQMGAVGITTNRPNLIRAELEKDSDDGKGGSANPAKSH